MLKHLLAASAFAWATLTLPTISNAATALPRIGVSQAEDSGVATVRHHGRMGIHHFHHGRRFHHGRFRGGPVFVYGYSYGPRCGWLRHRALVTGSRYWWHRYWQCRHGW